MTCLRNAAFAAMTFACLSSAASAAPLDTTQVRVVYADLDLASPAGQATLDRRLAAAVRSVCAADTADLAAKVAEARCRADAGRDVRAQVASLIDHRTTQVAAR